MLKSIDVNVRVYFEFTPFKTAVIDQFSFIYLVIYFMSSAENYSSAIH